MNQRIPPQSEVDAILEHASQPVWGYVVFDELDIAVMKGDVMEYADQNEKKFKLEITDEHRAEAQRLIDAGFHQVSRAHRMLVRLPAGKTGKQALLERAMGYRPWDAEQWVAALGEAHSGDSYLRGNVPTEDQVRVSIEVFEAFRKLGGDTYLGKHSCEEPSAIWHETKELLRDLVADPSCNVQGYRGRIDALMMRLDKKLAGGK